ncbi:hypothetical protein DRN85_07645 [Methanosarcinales archaeon]|nr:MAG: hypothetical protein DRN85_07645 [Methanosarcinales archaeon]
MDGINTMRIKSFQIKNYRSIKNSGVCYLSGDNITILAGKNESGKTTILEALEDFNTGKNIREEAKPLHNQEATPEIAVTFEVDKAELDNLFNKIGVEHSVTKDTSIEIIKKYPNEYSVSQETINLLAREDERKEKKKAIKDIYKQIKDIHSDYSQIGGTLPELSFENVTNLKNLLNRFKNQITPNLHIISDEKDKISISENLQGIINILTEMETLELLNDEFIKQIKQLIPNFVLFSSFDDIFPSEIPLANASNNEFIKDLAIISNLNLDMIRSGSPADRAGHKEQLNIKLKEDYEKFWTQDLTKVNIDWDSEKLYFFIKESGKFFPPGMRSKGRQWHLAFYIRISARSKEDVSNIILIDEPGLFLHAKAQKDILTKLQDSANDAPVIFSTHSPYLIETNKLSRVRLISRPEEDGTIVSNKIHKSADKETLTPIITAIGLDLSIGLDVAKDNNILVEGISDYYHLSAFKELLNFEFKKDVHFIPSAGADKIALLVSLMIGWGLNYCVVLDNDRQGREADTKLSKDFGHDDIKIILVSETEDEEIEDLFERDDFIKYILDDESNESLPEKKNSQLIKQRDLNYDKVLLSKSFFERRDEIRTSLSDNTRKSFQNLLTRIDETMGSFQEDGGSKAVDRS